jgi:hypothetical protein
MSKNKGEPSLEKIDDYNGNESRQKRNTVRFVIVFCLIIGGIFTYMKNNSKSNDQINVQEQIDIKK